jgi:predicted transcriptional regulator of viral defense system
MDYFSLLKKAKEYPLFKVTDVIKWFPNMDKKAVLNQLYLWTAKGRLERLKKGTYKLPDYEIKDTFVLAGFLYSPSYISLESALNSANIIPDIPFATTSIAIGKTQTFRAKDYGVFTYQSIKKGLFFGFETVMADKNYSYNIASPEKALFDYFYVKAGKVENPDGFIAEMRISLSNDFSCKAIKEWSRLVSNRNKSFHALVGALMKKYAK